MNNLQEMLSQIQLLLSQRQTLEASRLCGQAVSAYPQSWEAYALRGIVLSKQTKYEDALKNLKQALALGLAKGNAPGKEEDWEFNLNNQISVLVNIAQCEAELGQHAAAIETASQVLKLIPRDHPHLYEIYMFRGNVRRTAQQLAEALEDYQKALDLCPEDEGVLCAVSDLQQQIFDNIPEGTPGMQVTLKNGYRATIINTAEGKTVTLLHLAQPSAAQEPSNDLPKDEPVPQEQTTAPDSAAGKNPDAKAKGKQLLKACAKGDAEQVRALIASGADLQVEVLGETPLIKAILCGKPGIVTILLEAGADINAVNKMGQPPLLNAVSPRCKPEVFSLLLATPGVLINATDAEGNTALIKAAKAGLLDKVQALVEAGADTHLQNKKGQTALSLAQSCRHTAVAEWMQAHGC